MGVAQTPETAGLQAGTEAPTGPTAEATSFGSSNDHAKTRRRSLGEQWSKMPQGIRVMVGTLVGGAFALVIGIILTGFLFDMDLVSNFSGPFSEQLDTIQTVLGAAFTFSGLAMLAYAGSIAWSMFGGMR